MNDQFEPGDLLIMRYDDTPTSSIQYPGVILSTGEQCGLRSSRWVTFFYHLPDGVVSACDSKKIVTHTQTWVYEYMISHHKAAFDSQ